MANPLPTPGTQVSPLFRQGWEDCFRFHFPAHPSSPPVVVPAPGSALSASANSLMQEFRDAENLLLEDVAAVTGNFHADPKRYQKFYDRYATSLSGFPGIWKLCALAGKVFNELWIKNPQTDDYWIETVDAYVDLIFSAADAQGFQDVQSEAWLEGQFIAASRLVREAGKAVPPPPPPAPITDPAPVPPKRRYKKKKGGGKRSDPKRV